MLTLYDYFRSSACFRVRIALNLKNIPHELIPIHLVNNGGEQHSENFKKINPQQLVPALQHDDKILTQSLAIIEYLDELYPEPPLLPNTPFAKAEVRAFALTIVADIHPLNNLRILNYLTKELKHSDAYKNQWYQHWIMNGFTALEKTLLKKPNNEFCFGDQPTLADICLVPQMYNARRFSCDLSLFPNLVRVDANCQKNDVFRLAFPTETVT